MMPPILLAAVGRPLTRAPVPLAIAAVPDEGLFFPTALPAGGTRARRPPEE